MSSPPASPADYRRLRRALAHLHDVVLASSAWRRGGYGLEVSVAMNAAKKTLTETPDAEDTEPAAPTKTDAA